MQSSRSLTLALSTDANTPTKGQAKAAAKSVKGNVNAAMADAKGRAKDAKDDVKKNL